jgi:hypothetical protein
MRATVVGFDPKDECMRKIIFGAVCAAVAGAAMAADVGVSINIGQPGFYGQINIGGIPQPPPVLYPQPVIIERGPDYVAEPLYLYVPPGYERHWARHCHEYHACGRRVLFVNREWYQREYVPHYQRGEWGHPHVENRGHEVRHGYDQGHGHDAARGHDEERRHDRDEDHRRDHDGDH